MNYKELVNETASRAGLAQATTRFVVDSALAAIKAALLKGEDITIYGFGAFSTRWTTSRERVNFHTKERYVSESRLRPTYKPSNVFIKQMNK